MAMGGHVEQAASSVADPTPGTLGAVLYPVAVQRHVPEGEWAGLVAAVAAGSQPALHALYDRAHRAVFTLAVRIVGNRETAEEVTLDVFHAVWRLAALYDPANGTVLGWIMNQARSRSLDRLRFEQRKKRVDPGTGEPQAPEEEPDPGEMLEARQEGSRLRAALALLTPEERQAIQAAFFWGYSHSEIATRFDEPVGTIKTRIRSALRKLRAAVVEGENS